MMTPPSANHLPPPRQKQALHRLLNRPPIHNHQNRKHPKSHGAISIASPVSGAAAKAEVGQVTCVLVGPGPAIDQVKPDTTGLISKANIEFRDAEVYTASKLKIL